MVLAEMDEPALDAPASPYLTGVHTPMTEELTIEVLPVEGEIPLALHGRYLRMGPNPMAANPARHHWFAGNGMVHGIRIEDGRALWYRNRWIRSDAVTTALGEERTPGPRHAFDNVNTNVIGFAGKVFGMVEAGSTPVEFGETLETLRYTDFDGTLHGSFAAHPHLDPLTGELHATCYDATDRDAVRHVIVKPDGRVAREVRIPVLHGPMMHDSTFTQRFDIILDLPVTFSIDAAMDGFQFPYRWNEAHPARVGLLPRGGEASDIRWCPIDPCFVFHTLNAHDTAEGTVVLDLVVHDRMFWQRTTGPDSLHCGLERWIIDPVSQSVERTVLDPTPQEFPRIDERRLGQPYRYGYTMALTDPFLGTGLYKHDFSTRTRQAHDFGPGRHPCEFVFLPSHEGAAEDEGWLMGFVIDEPARTTDLVILDAQDFEGPPLASIRVPHVIPPGFHGNWVRDLG